MKQKYSHAECYRILKVKYDCSWEELRKSYKMQIQKWHPDRFEDGSAEKQAADEKIRYLNTAYHQLADYHRQHGQLPVVEKPAETRTSTVITPDTTAKARPTVNRQNTGASSTTAAGRVRPRKEPGKFRIYLTLAAAVTFSYILLSQNPTEDSNQKQTSSNPKVVSEQSEQSSSPDQTEQETDKNPTQTDNLQTSVATDNHRSEKTKPKENDFFTYGSSIGEVISVQGAPTRIEGDTWYYGDSEVYFYEGEVVKWRRMPGYPLKAQLIITTPGEDKKKSDKKISTNSLLD